MLPADDADWIARSLEYRVNREPWPLCAKHLAATRKWADDLPNQGGDL